MGRINRADHGWCILRTSAGRTITLADSLAAAGMDVWTPRRTVKRPAPGSRRRAVMGQRRLMVEATYPIIPGFVFARAHQLDELFVIRLQPFGPHPAFTILQLGGRVPLVGDAQVAGLRAAETEATAAITSEREAEFRDEARRARIEQMGSERARLKALRQQRKAFEPGAKVTVDDVAMLAGMVGTVIEGRGTSAVIHFGGSLTMTVEAWQVRSASVQSGNTLNRAAA